MIKCKTETGKEMLIHPDHIMVAIDIGEQTQITLTGGAVIYVTKRLQQLQDLIKKVKG
jgi:hypothetical protein